MNAIRIGAAIGLAALSSCGFDSPYAEGKRAPYGQCCVPYGDGLNPGIALMAATGTPVIAPSDGIVVAVGPNTRFGGHYVRIAHGDQFDTYYTHLSVLAVAPAQPVSRGQLLGLSGSDHTGSQYLHFGICRKGGSCLQSADSLNPGRHWLDGRSRCFDPGRDYSRNTPAELTAPLACGEHARALLARISAKRPE